MKEKEISAIAAKIEDEQSLGSKMQKQVITNHDHNHKLLLTLSLRKFFLVFSDNTFNFCLSNPKPICKIYLSQFETYGTQETTHV